MNFVDQSIEPPNEALFPRAVDILCVNDADLGSILDATDFYKI